MAWPCITLAGNITFSFSLKTKQLQVHVRVVDLSRTTCLCVRACVHHSAPECESREACKWRWVMIAMVLSLPFPGEQGYRLYTTGDFYFYIWKAKRGPANNNPPLPVLSSPSRFLLWLCRIAHANTNAAASAHTSALFRAPHPYLRLYDIQYVWDIKTHIYADEMETTIANSGSTLVL